MNHYDLTCQQSDALVEAQKAELKNGPHVLMGKRGGVLRIQPNGIKERLRKDGRWEVYGGPTTRTLEEAMAVFWYKVDKRSDAECWNWTGSKIKARGTNSWYGVFGVHKKKFLAHRLAYEWKSGKIPNDLLACHTCDNSLCVNPNHIFIGTHKDNTADMLKKGRSGFVKFSEDQKQEMFKMIEDGSPRKIVMERFAISECHLGKILNRRRTLLQADAIRQEEG